MNNQERRTKQTWELHVSTPYESLKAINAAVNLNFIILAHAHSSTRLYFFYLTVIF